MTKLIYLPLAIILFLACSCNKEPKKFETSAAVTLPEKKENETIIRFTPTNIYLAEVIKSSEVFSFTVFLKREFAWYSTKVSGYKNPAVGQLPIGTAERTYKLLTEGKIDQRTDQPVVTAEINFTQNTIKISSSTYRLKGLLETPYIENKLN